MATAVSPEQTGSVRKPAVKPQHDAVARALAIIADLPPHVRERFVYDGADHDDEGFADVISSIVFDTQNSLKIPCDVIMEAIARWAAELPEPEPKPEVVKPEAATIVAENSDKESSPSEEAATAGWADEASEAWTKACDRLDEQLNRGGWSCMGATEAFVDIWLKQHPDGEVGTAGPERDRLIKAIVSALPALTIENLKSIAEAVKAPRKTGDDDADPDIARVVNVARRLPPANRAELARALESGSLSYCTGPLKGSQACDDAIKNGQDAIYELRRFSRQIDAANLSLMHVDDDDLSEDAIAAAAGCIEGMAEAVRDELDKVEVSLGGLSRIISSYERTQAEE